MVEEVGRRRPNLRASIGGRPEMPVASWRQSTRDQQDHGEDHRCSAGLLLLMPPGKPGAACDFVCSLKCHVKRVGNAGLGRIRIHARQQTI